MVHFVGDACGTRDPPFEQMINNYLPSSSESILPDIGTVRCSIPHPTRIPSHPNIYPHMVYFDKGFNFNFGTNLGPKTTFKWLKVDAELFFLLILKFRQGLLFTNRVGDCMWSLIY